jgi:hypothetical protein
MHIGQGALQEHLAIELQRLNHSETYKIATFLRCISIVSVGDISTKQSHLCKLDAFSSSCEAGLYHLLAFCTWKHHFTAFSIFVTAHYQGSISSSQFYTHFYSHSCVLSRSQSLRPSHSLPLPLFPKSNISNFIQISSNLFSPNHHRLAI